MRELRNKAKIDNRSIALYQYFVQVPVPVPVPVPISLGPRELAQDLAFQKPGLLPLGVDSLTSPGALLCSSSICCADSMCGPSQVCQACQAKSDKTTTGGYNLEDLRYVCISCMYVCMYVYMYVCMYVLRSKICQLEMRLAVRRGRQRKSEERAKAIPRQLPGPSFLLGNMKI